MTGLEKMTSQIISEAKAEAEQILNKAKAQADGIKDEAYKKAQIIKTDAEEKARREVIRYKEKTDSSIEFGKRTAVLKAKQEVISDTLEKTYEYLNSMPDEDYFDLIVKMVQEHASDKTGTICFSKRDRDRIPDDFAKRIDEAAGSKGGKLSISQDTADIESGFVLVYGDIEENCSFRAMMNSRKDRLQDVINRKLFCF